MVHSLMPTDATPGAVMCIFSFQFQFNENALFKATDTAAVNTVT